MRAPHLLVAALVVVGAVVPAGATLALAGGPADAEPGGATGTPAATVGANNSSVNVTAGPQLATVLSVTSDDVQTEIEDSAFELSFERDDEVERAEAVAERAEELRERAERIREDYEEATEAYREGELTREEYARRLATLSARAENVLASHERLGERAGNVSALELRAAGLNRTALREGIEGLDAVTGAGPAALLARFTGETTGELELEFEDGLAIRAESEDGERSLEIERARDGEPGFAVNQSAALGAARAALPVPPNGSWALTRATIHEDDGSYRFEFRLAGANETGETEVRVDGSSGEVFRLESEIEPPEDEADDEDEQGDEGDEGDDEGDDPEGEELALLVAEGAPAANETVTVRVLAGGTAASNVTVYLNGEPAGRTDANGTVDVTLPASEEAKLTARDGEREGELEFEFGDDGDDPEEDVERDLRVEADLADGTATVGLTYDGSAVADATVYADGEPVGTTDANGTVAFAVGGDTDELKLELVKGEFETEREFVVRNGSLVPADTEDDEDEREDEDEDEREEEDEEGENEEDEDDSSGDGSGDDEDDSSGEGSSDDEDDSSGDGS